MPPVAARLEETNAEPGAPTYAAVNMRRGGHPPSPLGTCGIGDNDLDLTLSGYRVSEKGEWTGHSSAQTVYFARISP